MKLIIVHTSYKTSFVKDQLDALETIKKLREENEKFREELAHIKNA